MGGVLSRRMQRKRRDIAQQDSRSVQQDNRGGVQDTGDGAEEDEDSINKDRRVEEGSDLDRLTILHSDTHQIAYSEHVQGIAWDTVRDEYEGYISSYVGKCPHHLFDMTRQRNISRSELQSDISTALGHWIRIPLACSEVVSIITCCITPRSVDYLDSDSGSDSGLDTCSDSEKSGQPQRGLEEIRAYVFMAMKEAPLICGEARFISSLNHQLQNYNSKRHKALMEPVPIDAVVQVVCGLIATKYTQACIPCHHVHEQIALLGQYAILSHRWCQDGQELSFRDAANLSDPTVRNKGGFEKLDCLSRTIKFYYGCRYLWMDSLCIEEPYRSASIPLMFGWYRRAYICVVLYEGEWPSRGWTLQEFLAASRIKFFRDDWCPDTPQIKLDVCRGSFWATERFHNLGLHMAFLNWKEYVPGPDLALHLFNAMHGRATTVPEDTAYCLLSALDVNIPVDYGEGFDRAFYRLQVECLARAQDRRLLIWGSRSRACSSSRYNSMLAANIEAFNGSTRESIYGKHVFYNAADVNYTPPAFIRDSSISFDTDGVMRIMLSVHPWSSISSSVLKKVKSCKPSRKLQHGVVFVSLGTHTPTGDHLGVLLRPASLCHPSSDTHRIKPVTAKDHLSKRLPSDKSGVEGGAEEG